MRSLNALNHDSIFAIGRKDIGRFRVNVFRQRGEVGMVIRHIRTEIPDFETLGLPAILRDLIIF